MDQNGRWDPNLSRNSMAKFHGFQKPLGILGRQRFLVQGHLSLSLERQVPNAVCGCVDLGSDMPKDAPAAEVLKR